MSTGVPDAPPPIICPIAFIGLISEGFAWKVGSAPVPLDVYIKPAVLGDAYAQLLAPSAIGTVCAVGLATPQPPFAGGTTEKVAVGVLPAPPPRTKSPEGKVAEDDMCVVSLKNMTPPEFTVPAISWGRVIPVAPVQLALPFAAMPVARGVPPEH